MSECSGVEGGGDEIWADSVRSRNPRLPIWEQRNVDAGGAVCPWWMRMICIRVAIAAFQRVLCRRRGRKLFMSFGTPWVGHSQDCGGGPRSGEEEGTGSRRALKEGPDSPAETYDHKVDWTCIQLAGFRWAPYGYSPFCLCNQVISRWSSVVWAHVGSRSSSVTVFVTIDGGGAFYE